MESDQPVIDDKAAEDLRTFNVAPVKAEFRLPPRLKEEKVADGEEIKKLSKRQIHKVQLAL